jgi:hypothetical protein
VTEEEARTIIKAQGWSYHVRSRRGRGKKYLYVERMQHRKKTERYICPLSKLGDLTEQELLAKLTPKPKEVM